MWEGECGCRGDVGPKRYFFTLPSMTVLTTLMRGGREGQREGGTEGRRDGGRKGGREGEERWREREER